MWQNSTTFTHKVDVATESHRYTGVTEDLAARLAKHNEGGVPHTAPFKPWKLEVYFAFETKEKAAAFEAYLKTGSGHAFAKRHF
ncbi:MAG: GIY-YIG nuclease family protein [Lentisphaeria bacterium]|nr:GIY-YIG nuclease family protein [Lentisphaeria bacterium]